MNTLTIHDPILRRKAQELSERTGESIEIAIARAITDQLERVGTTTSERPTSIAASLLDIGKQCAALPDQDARSPEDILYNASGISCR